jgi:hypothetical protein
LGGTVWFCLTNPQNGSSRNGLTKPVRKLKFFTQHIVCRAARETMLVMTIN